MPKQKFPEPCVGAMVFNRQGKLFLMKSHKWRNKFVIPGGHVELGETIEAALRREIKEETGLKIFGIKLVWFLECIFDKAFKRKKHFIFFDHACKTNTTKVKLNSEGQEFTWVSLKEALKLPLEPYTKKTIKEYLKKFSKKEK